MKHIIITIILIFFTSCSDKDNYLSIIKDNNEILINQLDLEICQLKTKSIEARGEFVEKYESFNNIYGQIIKIKSYKDYELGINEIQNYSSKEKINFNCKKIKSENIEVLQNNLLVNFIEFCNYTKIFRSGAPPSNCGIMSRTKFINTRKYIKNDSINIDFESKINLSNYEVIIDSIIDNGQNKSNFKSDFINKFWKVKYKTNSKNSIIYWKVFLHDNNWNETILFEKGIDTITKKIK
ncbi:hypothetical protein [Flavobacterium sp.]|uniref:hypothetical protein n=1 Tax=Flavobacterium sp. TaxID=239 RepID=UPI003751B177